MMNITAAEWFFGIWSTIGAVLLLWLAVRFAELLWEWIDDYIIDPIYYWWVELRKDTE